jgi:hypothetical protein
VNCLAVIQIPAALNQAGGETLLAEIYRRINSVWNKEELRDQWKESIIVPVHKKGDKTDCYRGISAINVVQNFIQYTSFKVKSVYR